MGLWKRYIAILLKIQQDLRQLSRFVAKWTSQSMQTTFSSWIDFIDRRKDAVSLASRILRRMKTIKIHHSIEIWKSFMTVQRKIARDRLTLGRFVTRMRMHSTLKVFHSWVDFVEWRLRGKDIVGRFIHQLKHLKILQAFRSWAYAIASFLRAEQKRRYEEEVVERKRIHDDEIARQKQKHEEAHETLQPCLRPSGPCYFEGSITPTARARAWSPRRRRCRGRWL